MSGQPYAKGQGVLKRTVIEKGCSRNPEAGQFIPDGESGFRAENFIFHALMREAVVTQMYVTQTRTVCAHKLSATGSPVSADGKGKFSASFVMRQQSVEVAVPSKMEAANSNLVLVTFEDEEYYQTAIALRGVPTTQLQSSLNKLIEIYGAEFRMHYKKYAWDLRRIIGR